MKAKSLLTLSILCITSSVQAYEPTAFPCEENNFYDFQENTTVITTCRSIVNNPDAVAEQPIGDLVALCNGHKGISRLRNGDNDTNVFTQSVLQAIGSRLIEEAEPNACLALTVPAFLRLDSDSQHQHLGKLTVVELGVLALELKEKNQLSSELQKAIAHGINTKLPGDENTNTFLCHPVFYDSFLTEDSQKRVTAKYVEDVKGWQTSKIEDIDRDNTGFREMAAPCQEAVRAAFKQRTELKSNPSAI